MEQTVSNSPYEPCPAATWEQVGGEVAEIEACTFWLGNDGPHADGRGFCWAEWTPTEEVHRG